MAEGFDLPLEAQIAAEIEEKWHAGFERQPTLDQNDDLGNVDFGDLGLDQ